MNTGIEMTFHHVGIAVQDLEKALEIYTGIFGFRRVIPPLEVPPQRVKVCFLEAPPDMKIELVEPLNDKSPIAYLKTEGCVLFRRFEMPAYGLRRFAFLLTPDKQLFELCEKDTGHSNVGVS
jgi:catechol 2,3-dioxygenase-like lactoylglutathione lyase family enzyme